MTTLFKNDFIPRKLSAERQNEMAKELARYELVDILLQDEVKYKQKYEHALLMEAKEEAEDYKVMLKIVGDALDWTLN